MKRKRFVPVLLLSSLLITSVPTRSLAAVSTTDNVKTEVATKAVKEEASEVSNSEGPTEKALTNVLTEVKKKITIPKAYGNFSYYYRAANSYYNEEWHFEWMREDGEGSIYITSDSSGNIKSYYIYYDTDKKVPSYLKAELQSKADSFIKQVASNISSKLKFVNSYYSRGRNGVYYYNYIRVEQGIPMPSQQVQVGIDISTGEVISYDNSSWNYTVSIPNKNVKLSKEEAVSKLSGQISMNLVYHNRYTTDSNDNMTVKAYLVYEPSTSYIAVDASSGKIYTTLNEWKDEAKEASNAATAYDKATGSADGGLTEAEIKKIAEINGLISKTKAIETITKNKSLYVDSAKVVSTASLRETTINNGNKEVKKYVWNIQLSEPNTDGNENEYYRTYTSATVDAKTGEIISFYANVKEYYDYEGSNKEIKNVKYSKEQSQEILENFIKTQNKDRFLKSKLSSSSDQYVINVVEGKEVYGGYSFNYNRVNEGIVYTENQINGSVDGVTGKVTSYGYYWNDAMEFESPKGVITPKQAYEYYMDFDGFELVYELNTISTQKSMAQEARLVYRTEISPNYVSPFTGKQVHYDGSEYVKKDSNNSYEDIKDHKYYRSIQLFIDMGAVIEGNKFNPDQAITKNELQQMVEPLTYVSKENKLTGTSNITRQEAALYSIKLLDLNSLANINGIYKTGFVDEAEIGSSYLGAVALTKGLGILSADVSNHFYPTAYLTRAEAADMIIKMLAANR